MTTKEAGLLVASPASDIAELCRKGQIYAEKRRLEGKNFPEWTISQESFMWFLLYSPIYRAIFYKQEETDMKNTISQLLSKSERADKQTFTIAEVETILGLTKLEIYKLCWCGKLGHRLFARTFTRFDILAYIRHTPGAEEKLRDRYERALVNGAPTLMLLREIVTAYAYFKEYKYII